MGDELLYSLRLVCLHDLRLRIAQMSDQSRHILNQNVVTSDHHLGRLLCVGLALRLGGIGCVGVVLRLVLVGALVLFEVGLALVCLCVRCGLGNWHSIV